MIIVIDYKQVAAGRDDDKDDKSEEERRAVLFYGLAGWLTVSGPPGQGKAGQWQF